MAARTLAAALAGSIATCALSAAWRWASRRAARRRSASSASLSRLRVLNHVARETGQLNEMIDFYVNVLEFQVVKRPRFDFPGAWLRFPGAHELTLHLIHPDDSGVLVEGPLRDPRTGKLVQSPVSVERAPVSIRRGHHLALDLRCTPEEFCTHLERRGVPYHRYASPVPGTKIVQVFFHDPDGNGIEVGNY